ncbi:MAG: hypothetical protein RLZZ46_942 [Bacteroidota bacterium]
MESLLSAEQENFLAQAIAKAEAGTSGEIRIHFDRRCTGNPLKRAQEVFLGLGMQKTKNRNAVLIYIALDSKKVAIIGDKAIHESVRQDFWDQELKTIISHFSQKKFFEGLMKAIADTGEKLKVFFPADSINHDELPNDITTS